MGLRVYGFVFCSMNKGGYESRALREDEFHGRAQRHGYALNTEITYVAAPVIRGYDQEAMIEQCPMVLPSSMATGLYLEFLKLLYSPNP